MNKALLFLICSSFSYAMQDNNNQEKEYWVDYCVKQVLGNRGETELIHLHEDVEQAIVNLNSCENPRVTLLRIHDNTQQSALHLWQTKKTESEIKEGLVKFGAEKGNWTVEEAIKKIQEITGVTS